MEGKAKAEQDSLTQAEEEDTSVQAYCADSCRQRMRPHRKALVSLHWAQIIKGDGGHLGRANSKKLRDPTRIGSN